MSGTSYGSVRVRSGDGEASIPRDFRAARHVLEARDYALSGPRRRARDKIDPKTWHSIWDLPDSVAVATTDDYGTALRSVKELSGAWAELYESLGLFSRTQSPVAHVALESFDAFEASIENAVAGYYRAAFTALRSVVENMTIALHLELAQDNVRGVG